MKSKGFIVIGAVLTLIVIGIATYFFLGSGFIKKQIVVLDAETKLPIKDASVSLSYWYILHGTELQNRNGLTNKQGTASFRVRSIYKFGVKKEGYHHNGEDYVQDKKTLKRTVFLNNKKDIVKRAYISNGEFRNGDSIDLLSLIYNTNLPTQEGYRVTNDSDFSVIQKEDKFFIKGSGEAGAIFVSNNSDPIFSGEQCYVCMNTFIAPTSGYKTEVELKENDFYIIKLRDGKHFGKLHVEYNSNRGFTSLSFEVSLKEGTNIEFEDKVTDEEEVMQRTYELKKLYYDIIQQSKGVHKVSRIGDYGLQSNFHRIFLDNGFVLYPVTSRIYPVLCYNPIEDEAVLQSKITLDPVLPPWDTFVKTYSVDLNNYRHNLDFYKKDEDDSIRLDAIVYINGQKVIGERGSPFCLEY